MSDPALRAHLLACGAAEDELVGLDDGELIGLAGDLRLADGLGLPAAELAHRCGTSVERLRSIYDALGLDIARLPGFGDGDVRLVELVVGDDSGVVDSVAAELLRVAGMSLSRLAEAAVAAYVQDIENHPDRQREDLIGLAELNALASGLVVEFSDTLGTMFRHHMWTAVRTQRAGQQGLASPRLIRAGIGFVDLVGYTPMSQAMGPDELMAVVDGFEQRAFDIARRNAGRIVKSIGDEVMVTAPDHESVVAIALELISEFGDDPQSRPRGGVSAGEVVFRLGDFYGPVVNVASRLAAAAAPGELLTDVADESTSKRFKTSSSGPRALKGYEHPIEVWSIR